MNLHTVLEVANTSPYSQADNDEGEGEQGPAEGDQASADLIAAFEHPGQVTKDGSERRGSCNKDRANDERREEMPTATGDVKGYMCKHSWSSGSNAWEVKERYETILERSQPKWKKY